MAEKEFFVNVLGDKIQFTRIGENTFQAKISIDWMESHGVFPKADKLSDVLNDPMSPVLFLVLPNPCDLSYRIIATGKGENWNGKG